MLRPGLRLLTSLDEVYQPHTEIVEAKGDPGHAAIVRAPWTNHPQRPALPGPACGVRSQLPVGERPIRKPYPTLAGAGCDDHYLFIFGRRGCGLNRLCNGEGEEPC